MTWCFSGVGRASKMPEAIDRAIETYGEASEVNQSRKEFELVAPHLKALCLMNTDDDAISVNANGHAVFDSDGKMTYGSCLVKIEFVGSLVE